MRKPYDTQMIGLDTSHMSTYRRFMSRPEGNFSSISPVDGVRRLYYFRNFPDLPLILMVAAGEDDIYASWRRRAFLSVR